MAFYEDCKRTPEGEKINPTPTSIHFLKMGNYNPDWSLERIIFFEYMIVCRRSYGDGFFRQEKYMAEATRLSKYHLRKQRDYFVKAGFITVKEGKFSRYYYHLNKEWVYSNIDNIQDFSEIEEEKINFYRSQILDYYKYQLETNSSNTPYDYSFETLI